MELEGINFSENTYYEGYGSYLQVAIEEGIGVISITEFGLKIMKDIVYMELPSVGDEITQGETFGVLETIKATGELISPISGDVLEANEDATEDPTILKEQGDKSWLIKVKPTDLNTELGNIMKIDKAKGYYIKEIQKARADGLLK